MTEFWCYALVAMPFAIPVLGIGACVSTSRDERPKRSFVETRKVGGLRFVRVGRFGASFWVSRKGARQ
jgi:hypothetical protein